MNEIVRNYANGVADGFLNDLILASERGIGPKIDSETALIQAFKNYVVKPESLFAQ